MTEKSADIPTPSTDPSIPAGTGVTANESFDLAKQDPIQGLSAEDTARLTEEAIAVLSKQKPGERLTDNNILDLLLSEDLQIPVKRKQLTSLMGRLMSAGIVEGESTSTDPQARFIYTVPARPVAEPTPGQQSQRPVMTNVEQQPEPDNDLEIVKKFFESNGKTALSDADAELITSNLHRDGFKGADLPEISKIVKNLENIKLNLPFAFSILDLKRTSNNSEHVLDEALIKKYLDKEITNGTIRVLNAETGFYAFNNLEPPKQATQEAQKPIIVEPPKAPSAQAGNQVVTPTPIIPKPPIGYNAPRYYKPQQTSGTEGSKGQAAPDPGNNAPLTPNINQPPVQPENGAPNKPIVSERDWIKLLRYINTGDIKNNQAFDTMSPLSIEGRLEYSQEQAQALHDRLRDEKIIAPDSNRIVVKKEELVERINSALKAEQERMRQARAAQRAARANGKERGERGAPESDEDESEDDEPQVPFKPDSPEAAIDLALESFKPGEIIREGRLLVTMHRYGFDITTNELADLMDRRYVQAGQLMTSPNFGVHNKATKTYRPTAYRVAKQSTNPSAPTNEYSWRSGNNNQAVDNNAQGQPKRAPRKLIKKSAQAIRKSVPKAVKEVRKLDQAFDARINQVQAARDKYVYNPVAERIKNVDRTRVRKAGSAALGAYRTFDQSFSSRMEQAIDARDKYAYDPIAEKLGNRRSVNANRIGKIARLAAKRARTARQVAVNGRDNQPDEGVGLVDDKLEDDNA